MSKIKSLMKLFSSFDDQVVEHIRYLENEANNEKCEPQCTEDEYTEYDFVSEYRDEFGKVRRLAS